MFHPAVLPARVVGEALAPVGKKKKKLSHPSKRPLAYLTLSSVCKAAGTSPRWQRWACARRSRPQCHDVGSHGLDKSKSQKLESSKTFFLTRPFPGVGAKKAP